MRHYFGEIVNGEMKLDALGEIVKKYWLEIPRHFEHAKLDEFIVMPNHVHGIIILKNCTNNAVPTCRDEAMPRPYKTPISPKPKSLSVIIGSFKIHRPKTIRQQYPQSHFAWQSRFTTAIIRSDNEWYYYSGIHTSTTLSIGE
jgi:REP element-mobilizing transposase RayT